MEQMIIDIERHCQKNEYNFELGYYPIRKVWITRLVPAGPVGGGECGSTICNYVTHRDLNNALLELIEREKIRG